MKTIFSLVALIITGMLGCKPKPPLVEPKESAIVSAASPVSTTSSAQPTTR